MFIPGSYNYVAQSLLTSILYHLYHFPRNPFLTDVGRLLTPLSHLVQTAETIHSITLDWGIPHTITHYTILLVEPLEIEQEIKSVLHLGP